MKYVSPIIIIFGSIGNIISIFVFSQKDLRSKSTSVLLIALGIVDTILLNAGLLPLWISEVIDIDIITLTAVGCKLHLFFAFTPIYCSAWILVAITIERLFAVVSPIRSREIFSHRRAVYLVIIIIVCIGVLNVHFLWTHSLYDFDGEIICSFMDEYIVFYENVFFYLDAVIASYIPFMIMLVCNIAIISIVFKANKKRESMSTFSKETPGRMGQMTTILLLLNFTFLFTTSPVVIVTSFFDVLFWSGKDPDMESFYLAHNVTALLSYLNSSLNFVLYCLSGEKFRSDLSNIMSKICHKKKIKLKTNSMSKPVSGSSVSSTTQSVNKSVNLTIN